MPSAKINKNPLICLIGIFLLSLFLILSTAFHPNVEAASSNSSYLNFQARLLNSAGAIVPDGSYNLDFKIYNVASGGAQAQGTCSSNCLWEETYSGANQVTVRDGYISVNLGSITAFPSTIDWEQPLWLTMNVGGTGATPTWDGEMAPRIQLTALPYAFIATQLANNSSNGNRQVLGWSNPTGADTIIIPDTSGTICLQSGASSNACAPVTGDTGYIDNQTTLQSNTNFYIQGSNVNSPTGAIEASSNTNNPDILDLLNSSGAIVDSFSSTGASKIQPSTNTTSAFLINNASGVSLFTTDTSNTKITVGQGNFDEVGLGSPSGVSVSAGANQGGSLSGSSSTTYYYKVSAINSVGEAFPSSEVSIKGSSFTPISAPGQPTLADSTTSGSLATSTTYYYKVTALTANGETVGSAENSISTNSDTSITVSWTAVTGASSYNVYRGTSSNGENVYYNTTSTSYTDTGSAGTSGSPPTSNTATTNTNNAIVSFNLVNGATSYRVYRGTSSNGENVYYSTTSSPYTDTGSAGTSGSPTSSDATARVGIGTSAPSSNLEVLGTTFLQTPINTTSAFELQNAAGANLLSVDSQNNLITLGSPSAVSASLVFDNSANNNTITISPGATTASYSLILPQAIATNGYCLQATGVSGSQVSLGYGNCTVNGNSGVTTSGGTTDMVPYFTSSTQLGSTFLLYDPSTSVFDFQPSCKIEGESAQYDFEGGCYGQTNTGNAPNGGYNGDTFKVLGMLGGDASATNTTGNGGAGGAIELDTSRGGEVLDSADTGSSGNGGSIILNTGPGGDSYSNTTPAGNGGTVTITSGGGGNGWTSNNVTTGNGGNISITAGAGGQDHSIADSAQMGSGGTITIEGGNGGYSEYNTTGGHGTSGNGGNVVIEGGQQGAVANGGLDYYGTNGNVLLARDWGYVGVGTSSPQNELTVGTGNFSMTLPVPNAPSATPSTTGGSMIGGTYYYVISAVDGNSGETTPSSQTAVTISTTTSGSVALSWTSVPTAEGYRIYRSTTSNSFTSPSYIGTTTSTSYTDTALSASSGAPVTSNTANAVYLNPVAGMSRIAGSLSIGDWGNPTSTLQVVNQTASQGTAIFTIGDSNTNRYQFKADAGSGAEIDINSGSTLIKTQGSLNFSNSTTNMLSFDSSGHATFENNSNSTTGFLVDNATGGAIMAVDSTNGQVVLGTTGNINGQIAYHSSAASSGTVTLGASTSMGSSSYSILLPTAVGTSSTCLGVSSISGSAVQLGWNACSGGSGNFINNQTSLQANANFNIQSASTTAVTGTLQAASGGTADVLDLKNGSGQISSSYGPNGNANHVSLISPTISTSLSSGGNLATSTTYYIEVSAVDGTGGETLPSNSSSQTTSLLCSTGNCTINVNWSAISGAVAYKVYYNTTSASGPYNNYFMAYTNSYVLNAVPGASGSPVSTGGAYAYKLNTSGNISLQSLTNSVNALQVLNAAGYGLLNNDTSNGIVDIGQLSTPSITSSLVSGGSLPASTTYYFKVTANDRGSSSLVSNETWQTTAATCTTSGDCAINISWSAIPGASSYNVYYGTSFGGENQYFNTTATSYTFSTTSGSSSGTPSTSPTTAYAIQLANNGTALFQTLTNSATGFQVLNASSINVMTVDTTNGQVVLGATGKVNGQIAFNTSTGTANQTVSLAAGATTASYTITLPSAIGLSNQCVTTGTVSGSTIPLAFENCATALSNAFIKNQTSLQTTANFNIQGDSTQNKPTAAIQASTNSSNPDILDLLNSSGSSIVVGFSSLGEETINPGSTTKALQIINAAGLNLLTADTTNSRVSVGQLSTPTGLSTSTSTSGGTLAALTTYYFKVTALDAANGETTPSAEVSQATGAGVNSNSITISWTAITGAAKYRVYFGTSSGGETSYFVATTNSYTMTTASGISGSPPATNSAYAIRLAPAGTYLSSSVTIQPTGSTTAVQILNPAGNNVLTADTTNGQIILGSTGAVNGQIALDSSTSSTGLVTLSAGATSSSGLNLVLPTAAGSAGQCLAASTVSGSTVSLGFSSCSTGTGGAILNQTTSQSPGNFNIQGGASGKPTANIQADSYGDNTLNLMNYSATGGQGAVVDSFGSTGDLTIAPSSGGNTPLAVSNASGVNQLLINGGSSSIALGGQLAAPSGLTMGTIGTSNGALANANTYYYKVTAIDGYGDETTASAEVNTGLLSSCNTNGSAASYTLCSATLTWNAVPGAQYYKLYRGTSSGGENVYYLIQADGQGTQTYVDYGYPTTGSASPPTSNNAYTNNLSLSTGTTSDLSIGSYGSSYGQLYVGGGTINVISSIDPYGYTVPTDVSVYGSYAIVSGFKPSGQDLSNPLIYDISNPSQPVALGYLNVDTNYSSVGSQVFIQGNYAYVTDTRQGVMDIFNLKNLTGGAIYPVSQTPLSCGSNIPRLVVQGSYAYVLCNYSASNNGLYIVNVSNPVAPSFMGSVNIGFAYTYDIAVQGNYVYITGYNSSTTIGYFLPVDVSNPYKPVVETALTVGSEATSISILNRYAYVGDVSNKRIDVVDISNPTNLTSSSIVGTYPIGISPLASFVQGHYLYVGAAGASSNGFYIVDISNPLSPQYVNSGIPGNISGIDVDGIYAYIANNNNNLFEIVNIGGSYVQQLQTGGVETTTLTVDQSGSVNGDLSVTGQINVGSGIQASGSLGLINSGGASVMYVNASNGRVDLSNTEGILSAPVFSSVTAQTGTPSLAANTYTYEITAVDGLGGETLPSAPSTITTSSGQQVVLQWAPITGAEGYKIYRCAGSSCSPLDLYDLGGYSYSASTNLFTYTDSGQSNIGTNSVTPPTSASAKTYSDNTNRSNGQLIIGGNGTPTGQLYIGGTLPSIAIGFAAAGNDPFWITTQNKYAYVTNYNDSTFSVFDISYPSYPKLISTTSTVVGGSGSGPVGIKVLGKYLYIASQTSNIIQVWDVSNPNTPVFLSSIATGGVQSDLFDIQGHYLYVANYYDDSFSVIDITNPNKMLLVNHTVIGTATNGGPTIDTVYGKYLYIGEVSTANFYIYDISNPLSPTLVSTTTEGSGCGHVVQILVQGKYAYLSDSSTGNLCIYDISNPSSPSYVSTGHYFADYGLLQGKYLIASDTNTNVITVTDISNPYQPVYVGDFSGGVGVNGIAMSGRYLYSAAGSAKNIYVFDMGGTYSQQLESGGLETGTLQVDQGAQLNSNLNVAGNSYLAGSVEVNGALGISGNVLFGNSSNSSTSTQIDNASGVGLLNADTTNGRIGVGSLSAPSGVSATAGTTGGSLAASQTYYYKVTAIDAQGGETATSSEVSATTASSTSCPTTGSTCSITVSWTAVPGAVSYRVYYSQTTQSENNYFSTTSTSLIMETATTSNGTGNSGNSTAGVPPELSSAYAIRLASTGSATFQTTTNTTSALQVINSSGSAALVVDTTNLQILIGGVTAGANCTGVSGNGVCIGQDGIVLSGTARASRSIMLTAEYAGAVLSPLSGSNNTGTMTAGFDLTGSNGIKDMNYYNWTTAQSTSQSYDIVIQVPIPKNFSAWASTTPLTIDDWTSTLTAGSVQVAVYDSTGTQIGTLSDISPTVAASTWYAQTAPQTMGSSGTWTPGSYFTIDIRLTGAANSANNVRVGTISLNYLSSN